MLSPKQLASLGFSLFLSFFLLFTSTHIYAGGVAPVTDIFDVDGNGEKTALTDGLLVIRYLFGFRGDALVTQVIGNGATRTTAESIEVYLNNNLVGLDIDGNNDTKPLSDGLLLIRYLFGFEGDALINQAVAANATRVTASDIETYITSAGIDSNVTAARYRLTFDSTWSINTHPVNFPQGNPHFSPLVGAVHNSQLTLWQPGDTASTGIENMAESGSTFLLISEILNADNEKNSVLEEISGPPIPFSPGSTSLEFDITPEFPEVSFVSMLAPSPDWFIGVHNLNLFENGTFVPSKTVPLNLYDAGTDSGLTYTSSNTDTQPKQVISLLSSNPIDSSFVDGGPDLGTFTFERISITEE